MKNLFSQSKDQAAILVLCVLAVWCWMPQLDGPIDLRWDGGAYYILGTAIAEGKGYKLLSEPGEINSTLHQPLLPATVAAHQKVLGTSDPVIVGRWLRVTFFLAFIVYVLAAYLMFRFYFAPIYAFVAALTCLLHSNTLFLSGLLYTEILFALTTVSFFICLRKSDKKIYDVLSVMLAFAAYGLRTIGVALFAAWIGESLLDKNYKKAFFRLAAALIPILCWQSYVYTIENSAQYQNPAYEYQRADYMYPNVSYARNSALADPFVPEKGYVTLTGRIKRFADNAVKMPIKLGEAVSAKQDEWIFCLNRVNRRMNLFLPSWVLSRLAFSALLILSLLIVAGAIIKLLNRQWFIPIYVLAYSTMLCVTPWSEQFGRYLMPLMPFLIVCLFETFLFLKTKSDGFLNPALKFANHLFAGSILLLILITQTFTVRENYGSYLLPVAYNDKSGRKIEYKQFFYYQPYQNLDEGLDWLLEQSESGDVVAGTWCHWIHLRTGLRAVLPPFETDPVKAQNLLDTVPVKYLLLEKDDFLETKRYVSSVVENAPHRWKLVFSTSDGRLEIYERIGE